MAKLTVAWLSAGVSSFIAAYLIKDEIDEFYYIDIDDQHPDSMRFIKDCEKLLEKPIKILKDKTYGSVENTCRSFGFIKHQKNGYAVPQFNHRFPLIEKNMTKQDAHGFSRRLGLKRPQMYDMGYKNNNCIGCVKGGMGYWNKIRKDFPEVFKARAELERKLNCRCLKECFLDELNPNRGNVDEEIMEDCGIFCEINLQRC